MASAGRGWRLYDVLRIVAMGSLEWQVPSFVVHVDGGICCAGADGVLRGGSADDATGSVGARCSER